MTRFVYNIPTKVYFGKDQLSEHLAETLAGYGKRVLLTYGGGSIKKTGLYDAVMKELNAGGFQVFELSGIEPNPRIDSVRKGAQLCKDENIDVILAVGGGSTLDASKWMAAGACVDFDPWDFFQSPRKPLNGALPLVTILTLSATGSEMDGGGVISNPETNDKMGRMEDELYPRVSFLDPCNTFTVSPYQTACGAADILSHIIEEYFNAEDGNLYMIDRIMEALMKTVVKYAPVAIAQPDNYEARANLMWASSWAINGFIKAGKKTSWSCHPMEHQLSAYYDITHGLGLAILTPRWMKHCMQAQPDTTQKFADFAINVFDIDKTLPVAEAALAGVAALEKFLFEDLKLTSNLSDLNIGREHFADMAQKAVEGGTMKAYVALSAEDVANIYEACL